MAALSHVKSDTIGDFTGTVTGFNSQGSTTTIVATDLVRPSDWNSAHNFFQTISGNTLGTSTASGTNLVIGGTGDVHVSHDTAAGAATLWVGQRIRSGYNPYQDYPMVTAQAGQGSLQIDPKVYPAIQFDRIAMGFFNTNSSNSSGSHTISVWVGFYTRNAGTLSLLTSTSSSTALTHSGTAGSYSLYSGQRLFTIPMTTTLTAGEYFMGFLSRTTSGGANGSYSNIAGSAHATNFLGHFGSSHNTSYQWTLGQGRYSATTNALPNAISISAINGSGSAALRPIFLMFASSTV